MSFFDSSPNFIRQKLIIEFKDLDQEETLAKYEGVKSKTREKLRDYYPKVKDKSDFYKEIIRLLGTKDGDFILLNLFFELDIDSIVLELKQSNHIGSLKCFESDSLSSKLLLEMNKNENFRIDQFLEENFINLIDLPAIHWNEKNQKNELIREFIKWLNKMNDDNQAIEKSIFLFEKIWSVFFSNPFNDLKARVFVGVLIEEISKSSSVPIHKYLDGVKQISSELFIKRRYSIMLDGIDFEDELSQAYQTKRAELEELLDKQRSKDKSFISWSYQEIFESFSGLNEPDKEKVIKDLILKIDSGDIPNESDINSLNKFQIVEIVNLINVKCYLFEKIAF